MPFESTMEVLTLQGWRRWDSLKATAELAVPSSDERKFSFEKCQIQAFKTDEPLVRCTNKRIEFGLTEDHQMPGTEDLITSFRLDTLAGYYAVDPEGELEPRAQLAAFWCGDGYKISKNRIGFGLKKDRKKTYLKGLLKKLNIAYEAGPHKNRPGYLDFVVDTRQDIVQEVLLEYINDWEALAQNKHLKRARIAELDGAVIRGYFDALMESDGHIKKDRPQLQFTSTSPTLHSDFQLLSAMLGRDAHYTHHEKKEQTLSYNPDKNQELRVKAADVSKQAFEGHIYSAKTSSGLVFVRGNSRQFGFVAGCA